jgi:hypothetical protein
MQMKGNNIKFIKSWLLWYETLHTVDLES